MLKKNFSVVQLHSKLGNVPSKQDDTPKNTKRGTLTAKK